MPARLRDRVSMPRAVPSRFVRHDYGIDDSISRMGYLSNAVLEDTFDAASKSRGKDHELLRNANSAIRPMPRLGTSLRNGRQTHRFSSVPPRGRSLSPPLYTTSASSPTQSQALMPYDSSKLKSIRMALTPSPTSLLSSRISAFLRGSSVPPTGSTSISYKSYLDSATPPLPPSMRDNVNSVVSYKSYLSDPSITSPFSTRSSTRQYKGYELLSHRPSSTQTYRSASVPRYVDDDEDAEQSEEEEEDYQVGDYRRKYKIVRGTGSSYVKRPRVLYYKTNSPEVSDVEDEDDTTSRSGTYSLPYPSGVSPLRLSSYDAPYDGSYEADMAEMNDYVPFGPSRQGILELTQHEDYANDDNTTLQPSSFPPLSIPPSVSSYESPVTRPLPPSVSLIPHTQAPSSGELTSPSSFSHSPVFESILASTAARARTALRDSNLPYKDASLVLSLEGNAVSEDGRDRYGFRYYPPPIPLKGSRVGLDERILGIMPQTVSPADSFLGGYLNRLRTLRSDVENRADSLEERTRSRSVVPRPLPHLPTYTHETFHMPIHIAGRAQSVPVSSYRSPLDGGGSHRVDVFPLVETQTTLSRDALRLPLFQAGHDTPTKLSILDKINIKAAIIGSKMEAADSGNKKKRPRSLYAAAKYRETRKDPGEENIFYNTSYSGGLQASRPPLPKPTDRKAIRDVDGFTKPRNVMSWQYRVESSLKPDDLIDTPSSFSRMRTQVRDAQEKMDKHRQLLDRYLDKDPLATNSTRNNNTNANTGAASSRSNQ